MAPPQRTKRRGFNRQAVQVYASSSDLEDCGRSTSTNHARKYEAKKASSKKRRSNWSDDDFSHGNEDDEQHYLHIQNGQGISDAIAVAPSPRRKKHKSDQPRGLRHSHLWRTEFPPWLRKVDSNTVVCPNEELERMAAYLSVKPQEITARREIVRVISDTIRSTFHHSHELQFHLFGSLATATSSLATFRSDIDLTIEVVPPPSSEAVVYTSAMYDDDDDEYDSGHSFFDGHDADFDISAMQFNFITHKAPAPSRKTHVQVATLQSGLAASNLPENKVVMTRAERNQCVRFLHKAARALRQAHPSFSIEVRRLAKVPIINVIHRASAPRVTRAMSSSLSYIEAGKSLTLLVAQVLLKEFLYQNGINKPYEGGIGSFRLYCMVTHVVAASNPRDGAATLLLRFFERFGCAKTFNNRTVLRLRLPEHDPPLKCDVEFTSIFRLRDCNYLFHQAFERLQRVLHGHGSMHNHVVVKDDDADTTSGVLASLFWTYDLRQEREHRLALAVQHMGHIAAAVPSVEALVADDIYAVKKKQMHKIVADKKFGKKRITTSAKKLKRQLARRLATGQ
ncbi:hypothetical protein DYB32_007946 [Aphanomyces invadans]|uniref:Polymerase nucleotidyl transferase domain-containing protein n=1 Tax=Aphanomyces invadans TaxID=157072 RepID=A0A3R7CW61_9STRA|nr:hypothetical protein DYB32_007946 [Aphanomyces invadans]